MTWKKGESGNKGGRPKEIAHVKELAKEYSTEAIEKLVFWMRSDSEKSSVRAAEVLLNRAWGTPETCVELTGKDGAELVPHITVTIKKSGES